MIYLTWKFYSEAFFTLQGFVIKAMNFSTLQCIGKTLHSNQLLAPHLRRFTHCLCIKDRVSSCINRDAKSSSYFHVERGTACRMTHYRDYVSRSTRMEIPWKPFTLSLSLPYLPGCEKNAFTAASLLITRPLRTAAVNQKSDRKLSFTI